MQGNPRAVVADDSHFIRSVITDILSAGGIEVVGEAHNGCEAVAAVREHEPDVVTMAIVKVLLVQVGEEEFTL